jgi:hypothetical protein
VCVCVCVWCMWVPSLKRRTYIHTYSGYIAGAHMMYVSAFNATYIPAYIHTYSQAIELEHTYIHIYILSGCRAGTYIQHTYKNTLRLSSWSIHTYIHTYILSGCRAGASVRLYVSPFHKTWFLIFAQKGRSF